MSPRSQSPVLRRRAAITPALAVLGGALLCTSLVVLPASLALDVALPIKATLGLSGVALALGICAVRQVPRSCQLGWTAAALTALVILAATRLGAGTDPSLAQQRLVGLLLLAGAFVVGRATLAEGGRARRRAETLLVCSAAMVSVLGWLTLGPLRSVLPGVDAGASTFATRNLAAGFVALILPLAYPTAGGRGRWLSFSLMCSYILASGNRLAVVAAVIAIAPLCWHSIRRGKRARTLLGIAFATGALLLFVRTPRLDDRTVVERLHLWGASLEMIAEAPLAGHGPGQWAVEYPRVAASGAEDLVRLDRLHGAPASMVTVRGFRQPAHAHQELLELGAELGLPAALVLLIVLGAGAGGLTLRSRPVQRSGAACLSALVLCSASFPLIEPASALTLGLVLAMSRPTLGPSRRSALCLRPLALAGAGAAAVLAGLSIPRLGAEAHLREALAHSTSSNHREAARSAELARALAPDDFRTEQVRALAYAASWETGAALEAVEQALSLRPWAPNAWNDLGLLLRREGRLVEAEAALRRAHSLLPGDAHVNANLGALLVSSGRSTEARECYRRAIAENPNIYQAWEGLADCAFLENDLVGAWTCLEQARAAKLRCGITVQQRRRV